MKKESIVLTLTLALVCWLLLGEGAVLFAKEDYKKVDNKESCIVARGWKTTHWKIKVLQQ